MIPGLCFAVFSTCALVGAIRYGQGRYGASCLYLAVALAAGVGAIYTLPMAFPK